MKNHEASNRASVEMVALASIGWRMASSNPGWGGRGMQGRDMATTGGRRPPEIVFGAWRQMTARERSGGGH